LSQQTTGKLIYFGYYVLSIYSIGVVLFFVIILILWVCFGFKRGRQARKMTRGKEMGSPQFPPKEAGLLLSITNLNEYVPSPGKCLTARKKLIEY
jgi:hypothetical protein